MLAFVQVHIEFLEDKDKIIIEGPPAEVQAAENLLSSSLKDLVSSLDFSPASKWLPFRLVFLLVFLYSHLYMHLLLA